MKEEIKEFVRGSIKQIKDALPEGFILEGKLDFDVSVTTKSDTEGKLNIKLAGIGRSAQTSQSHRLRFSIVDEKEQEKKEKRGLKMLNSFFGNLAQIDQKEGQPELPQDNQIRKPSTKQRNVK